MIMHHKIAILGTFLVARTVVAAYIFATGEVPRIATASVKPVVFFYWIVPKSRSFS